MAWRVGGGALGRALGRFARAEGGALAIFGLFVVLIMMMAAGLAVDTIRHERERVRLQATLDRAVLAAADLEQERDAETVVKDYFAAAGLSDVLGDITVSSALNHRAVTASASIDVPTMLLHMVGVDTLAAATSAQAEERVTDIEISLVLDMSGSMKGTRLERLEVAAKDFVKIVLGDGQTVRRTTISIVPFSSQVSAGKRILSHFNVTNEHNYSHCVSFDAADFRETVITDSAAHPLQRVSNFALDSQDQQQDRHPKPRDRYCPIGSDTEILPWSDDAEVLEDYIEALTASGGTSIDVGAKWGAALLDPSMSGVLDAFVGAGKVNPTYGDRPAAYDGKDVVKVMVVLSDGENYPEARAKAQYRSGLSGFWVDPKDDLATETDYLNDRYSAYRDRAGTSNDYYRVRNNTWHHVQDGESSAHEMSWPELFHRMSVEYFSKNIIEKSHGVGWKTFFGSGIEFDRRRREGRSHLRHLHGRKECRRDRLHHRLRGSLGGQSRAARLCVLAARSAARRPLLLRRRGRRDLGGLPHHRQLDHRSEADEMKPLTSWLRRLARAEDGTATVELVILLPAFVLVMVNAIEASVLMTRANLLDRGLDMAVRELRLNTDAPPGFDAFRALICERSGLPEGCVHALQVELQPVSTATWALLGDDARCVDRREEIDPLTELDSEHYRVGGADQLMMVRACLVVDPLTPNYGLGALLPKDPSGGYRLIAVSAYVQEPGA